MVYYSGLARIDLRNIFEGLVSWQTANGEKHLTRAHVLRYVRDVKQEFDGIDKLPYHYKAAYDFHKQYGEYVHRYKRNPRTMWYACYDWRAPNALVNRIINNYCTVQ